MNDKMEYLREKVKFHIRDVHYKDTEIDEIILTVIEDIAREVKLFRKLNGFTVHKDKQIYDFFDMSRMNEEVEEELENVYTGGFLPWDLVDFIKNPEGEWPDPWTIKKTFIEEEFMKTFGVIGIFDENVRSVMDKFHNTGTVQFVVRDEFWLERNDGKTFAALIYGLPKINEMPDELLNIITSCVIEGCKYYFANTLQSTADTQISNLFYQRYWYKKKELMDMYPTNTFFVENLTKDRKWV